LKPVTIQFVQTVALNGKRNQLPKVKSLTFLLIYSAFARNINIVHIECIDYRCNKKIKLFADDMNTMFLSTVL